MRAYLSIVVGAVDAARPDPLCTWAVITPALHCTSGPASRAFLTIVRVRRGTAIHSLCSVVGTQDTIQPMQPASRLRVASRQRARIYGGIHRGAPPQRARLPNWVIIDQSAEQQAVQCPSQAHVVSQARSCIVSEEASESATKASSKASIAACSSSSSSLADQDGARPKESFPFSRYATTPDRGASVSLLRSTCVLVCGLNPVGRLHAHII